ncbi:MAG TPA: hypothetical protein VMT76_07985 [Puia sp.]|nr:hypothetical protein [Puia sp.]
MKVIDKPLLLTLSTAIWITLFSCKKNPEPVVDNTGLLQNKNWKITKLTISPAYFGITDVLDGLFADCEKDNLYEFESGGIFIYDEGVIKCDSISTQQSSGTWSFNNSSKKLHFESFNAGINQDISVSNISEANFSGTSQDTLSDGTHTISWTFSKQ